MYICTRMESLLCNEVWLVSDDENTLNVQENDGIGCNANAHDVASPLFSTTKEDCEEAFGFFLAKEKRYMPEPGYVELIKTNDLINNARFKAVNWLVKSQRRMNLSLGTVFTAVNYLDRFISLTQCQGWKYSMFELLSIACLSVASKFNETTTRPLHGFQLEAGHENLFSPSLIQRMELTVLKELGWRMDSTTPFSYVDLLIQRTIDDALNKTLVEDLTNCVTELLLCSLLDPRFLEFQQCVIAISAVRCAFEHLLLSTSNASLAHLDNVIPQDQKDDLIKCQRIMGKLLVQDHNNMLYCGSSWQGPSSPVTVLKVEWFSFYDFPVDLSLQKTPEINVNLRSDRKRKREEVECELCID